LANKLNKQIEDKIDYFNDKINKFILGGVKWANLLTK
jgi:hypothetical protein